MSERKIIPIGPYHPLQEEPEYFKLYCEGETVVELLSYQSEFRLFNIPSYTANLEHGV